MHGPSSWSYQTHQHLLLVESLETLLLAAAPAGACFANALWVLRSSQRSDLRYGEGWYVVLIQEEAPHPQPGSLSVSVSPQGWLEIASDQLTGIIDPTLAQAILMHPMPVRVLYFPVVSYRRSEVEQALTQAKELLLIVTDGREATLSSYRAAYSCSRLIGCERVTLRTPRAGWFHVRCSSSHHSQVAPASSTEPAGRTRASGPSSCKGELVAW
ncbi:hypothetical protein A4R35_10295 [Thermogemmatispora tikiterensis]|uniref:Uncharacterized protein n=1 Tax=Thermogemmatispora tikiterensis TaxID=1825093 RepID=A0A328VP35_9CHLR|nr:hypothetical protein A4R35_10295 [Thermogemmatispora tikiterensis]